MQLAAFVDCAGGTLHESLFCRRCALYVRLHHTSQSSHALHAALMSSDAWVGGDLFCTGPKVPEAWPFRARFQDNGSRVAPRFVGPGTLGPVPFGIPPGGGYLRQMLKLVVLGIMGLCGIDSIFLASLGGQANFSSRTLSFSP